MFHDGESLPPAPDAIPAATVVVLRDHTDGMEVLMLRRSSKLEFAGGMWVFPGGRVDEADHTPEGTDPELDAARQAAVREAEEEASLFLDPTTLVPLSHWVPPAFNFRRYATWFFVAPAPIGSDTAVADGVETTEHMWVTPQQGMELRDAGEIELAPPTWVTLHWIAQHPNVQAAISSAAAETPGRFTTQFASFADGRMASLWQGDAAYGLDDPDTPGARHRLWMSEEGWRYERSG